MSTTIVVSDEQVESAQALVRIAGGLDKVDPLIRKIAQAEPRRTTAPKDRRAS